MKWEKKLSFPGVLTRTEFITVVSLGEEIKLNQGENQELLAKKKVIDDFQIN